MSTTTTYTGVRIVDMPDLGAVTDSSSVVGERAGSGRFAAAPMRDYVLKGGQMSADWLSPLISWPATSSKAYVLSSNGCMAVTGASDTAHSGGVTYPVAIGVSGFGFANLAGTWSSGSNGQAWAGYFEARIYPGVNSYAWGIEVDVANVTGTDAVAPTPYILPAPSSVGINLESGAGVASDTPPLTANKASAGLYLGNNGASFQVGMVFGKTAINGTDGTTGTGTAINFATGHVIKWTRPDGTDGPQIFSVQTSGNAAQLVFDTDVAYFRVGGATPVPLLGLSTLTAIGAGNTALELRVNNTAGVNYVPVTLGAPDSGGAGYRVLRVPN